MSGLDDMPPIDPRRGIADKAEAELGMFVSTLIEKYELTYGEVISVLAAVTSRWAVRLVRDERKPKRRRG